MKFDEDIGSRIVEKLTDEFPSLPRGKVWIKYDKHRIYFNEKTDDIDYTFYVDFTGYQPKIKDFEEEYWLAKLESHTKEHIEHTLERITFEEAYPLDENFPATTVGTMKKYRRFECVVLDEDEQNYRINLITLDLEVDFPKKAIEDIQITGRLWRDKEVKRVIVKRDNLEMVMKDIEKAEEEADQLFMQQMINSTPSKISITQKETERSKGVEIVDEEEPRKCLNCHKEFIYHPGDKHESFCDDDCKVAYQQTAW